MEKRIIPCDPPPPLTTAPKPQGADPPSLPFRVAKAGRNHLNEGITQPFCVSPLASRAYRWAGDMGKEPKHTTAR